MISEVGGNTVSSTSILLSYNNNHKCQKYWSSTKQLISTKLTEGRLFQNSDRTQTVRGDPYLLSWFQSNANSERVYARCRSRKKNETKDKHELANRSDRLTLPRAGKPAIALTRKKNKARIRNRLLDEFYSQSLLVFERADHGMLENKKPKEDQSVWTPAIGSFSKWVKVQCTKKS